MNTDFFMHKESRCISAGREGCHLGDFLLEGLKGNTEISWEKEARPGGAGRHALFSPEKKGM